MKATTPLLSDKRAKTRAEKMIEMMEQRRDQMLDMQANRRTSGWRVSESPLPIRKGPACKKTVILASFLLM